MKFLKFLKFAHLCIVFSIFQSLTTWAPAESLCKDYLDLEERLGCGEDGYLMHYGYKNCLIFTNEDVRKKFSDVGRTFVDCCRNCLMADIHKITEKERDCEKIRVAAFKSHVTCYLQCDFCEVCRSQKLSLLGSYDWRDFFSVLAAKQIVSIVRACGLFHCFF
ncbi:unnamed protein product [Caenorhabditis auriculariae]|uniref:Uncharacterized protein n=1 Tax=Caenorhabditis auriculariae TaxID=2777116 RepID=A0A8S1GME8_9PELO|nr:unnamed protein product [Caenorhabditis auriculariae]